MVKVWWSTEFLCPLIASYPAEFLFGEASLRRALREFDSRYHSERNHQGVGNRLLEPAAMSHSTNDSIKCRGRRGGMLDFYYREAA